MSLEAGARDLFVFCDDDEGFAAWSTGSSSDGQYMANVSSKSYTWGDLSS